MRPNSKLMPRRRIAIAAMVRSPLFKQRRVELKTAYRRKPKHRGMSDIKRKNWL
jgi:stalled ribosome alternative rescue factor ArfA